jgi:hypothetical protein
MPKVGVFESSVKKAHQRIRKPINSDHFLEDPSRVVEKATRGRNGKCLEARINRVMWKY